MAKPEAKTTTEEKAPEVVSLYQTTTNIPEDKRTDEQSLYLKCYDYLLTLKNGDDFSYSPEMLDKLPMDFVIMTAKTFCFQISPKTINMKQREKFDKLKSDYEELLGACLSMLASVGYEACGDYKTSWSKSTKAVGTDYGFPDKIGYDIKVNYFKPTVSVDKASYFQKLTTLGMETIVKNVAKVAPKFDEWGEHMRDKAKDTYPVITIANVGGDGDEMRGTLTIQKIHVD